MDFEHIVCFSCHINIFLPKYAQFDVDLPLRIHSQKQVKKKQKTEIFLKSCSHLRSLRRPPPFTGILPAIIVWYTALLWLS